MKRTLISLFALVLASCSSVPPVYTWCYTYDLSVAQNSAGVPFYVEGDVTPSGILVTGGLFLSGDESSLDFSGSIFTKYEVVVYNPDTSFDALSFDGYVLGSYLYATDFNIPSGYTTFRTDPNTSPSGFIEINLGLDSSYSELLYLVEATVYGTATNPYPRNDCPPLATPTPAPWVYATIPPQDDPEGEGTQTRFDYIISAGDVMVSVLLVATLLSLWSMFVYTVIRDGD